MERARGALRNRIAAILGGMWLVGPRLPIGSNDQIAYARASVFGLPAIHGVIEIATVYRWYITMKRRR